MDKPYLFLDVDGVLNALDGLNQGDWDDFKKVKVLAPPGGPGSSFGLQNYTLRLSKSMCLALNALPVETHWATTWEHLANDTLGQYTDFNEYPVACRFTGTGFITDPWWKMSGIVALLQEDPRPFIWIDDEAIPPDAPQIFDAMGVKHLLIRPNSQVGITRAHIQEIKDFIDSLEDPDG